MSSNAIGVVMVFLLGTGNGLPLGLPPAPEDPVIRRVAPAECLAYVSWSGVAAPDPTSTNQTEQLLAEKEIQMLVQGLQQRIVDSMLRETADNEQGAAAIRALSTVAMTILTSPTAVFVSKAGVGPQGLDVAGGLVVNLGDRADEVEKTLTGMEQAVLGRASEAPGNEKQWRSLPAPAGVPPIQWDIKKGYLIVGVGAGEADRIYARTSGEMPAWLADLRKQLAVPRPANLVYLNVAGIAQSAAVFLGADAVGTIRALGLDKVRYVASMTGLDETGCVTRALVATDGPQETGPLALAGARPLTKADLAPIPRDATMAMAARFDLAKAFQLMLDGVGQVDADARLEMVDRLAYVEGELGLNFAKDVFGALGDTWRIYNAPGEGMIFTGLVAAVDLRDRKALERANQRLVEVIRAADAEPQPDRFFYRAKTIGQFEFEGQTVYFVKAKGYTSGPFAPAWCITDDELILGAFPHTVKSYLTRKAAGDKAGSLADVPAVAAMLSGDQPPVVLSYQNAAEAFKSVYPMVQMFATFIFAQSQREGIDLDVSLLPSSGSIIPHLRPGTVAVRQTASGVMIESHQSLPMGGGGEAVAMPLLLGLGAAASLNVDHLPNPRETSIINLKMIGLGLHNYSSTYDKFPATAAPLKEGQPPVSWRVLVLPYVENQSLFEQYRLDEPWDSENNKKLIAEMPSVYKAVGSKVAKEGKTNYLAVVGEGMALSKDEPTRLRDIADGTSHTIMVVEASDAKAVPWTKPEDFTPDEKTPIAGLVGLRSRGFLALFADGHVQIVVEKISPATLRALFTRAGEESVDPMEAEGGYDSRDDLELQIEESLEAEPMGKE